MSTRWLSGGLLVLTSATIVFVTTPSFAQQGVVLALRPEGVVVDLGDIEGVQAGTKLGFVRVEAEPRETAQGTVIEVRQGKALVKLLPKGTTSENDAVVACPVAGQDERMAPVRERIQAAASDPSAAPVVAQMNSVLAARDAALQKGACYLGSYDLKLANLLEQLPGSTATAATAAPPAGGAPSSPPAEQPAQARAPAEPTAGSPPPAGSTASTIDSASRLLDSVGRLADSLGLKKDRSTRSQQEASPPPAMQPTTDTMGSQPPAPMQSTLDQSAGAMQSMPGSAPAQPQDTASAPAVARSIPSASSSAQTPPGGGWWSTPASPTPAQQPAGGGSSPRTSTSQPAEDWSKTPSRTPDRRGPMVVLPVPGRRLPDTATRTPSTALHLLTLSGKVVDQTGRPVSGVKIAIAGAGAETNGQGVFRLDVKPGVHELRATAPGFHPEVRKLSLQQGAVAPVTLTLRRAEAGPRAPTSRTGAPRKFGEEGSSDDQSFGKPDDSFNK